MSESRELHGRSAVYIDYDRETVAKDFLAALDKASQGHDSNAGDISYLYDYYRGDQPILSRVKTYNTDIMNMIVENRAKEISDFKVGYLLSAALQYIDAAANDADEDADSSDLRTLNRWMRECSKDACDLEVAFWQSICGTAYRMVSPKDAEDVAEGGSPFDIMCLDPRYTFVAYSSSPDHVPLIGATYVTDSDGNKTTYAYTADTAYVVVNGDIVSQEQHMLGQVPVVEYPMGPARMGDFEPVIPILDAINTIQSSREDAVEQFVQAIMVMEGVDPGDVPTFLASLKENGGLVLPEGGKAYYLTLEMDQAQNQTLVDGMYDAVLRICGMPNSKSAYNTSDTGAAVVLRDGWSATEAVACRTETWFKRSERRLLDIVIDFCSLVGGLSLAREDVDIRFPRRNYTNDSSNVDNLIKMLSSDWIRPEFAYEHSNLTPDPHSEYLLARAWHDAQEDADVESLAPERERTFGVQDGAEQDDALIGEAEEA